MLEGEGTGAAAFNQLLNSYKTGSYFVGVPYSVAFSPDGKALATASHDKTTHLWDTATAREIHRFDEHGGPVYSVAFSPDGKSLATASYDKTVRLWDIASSMEIRRFEGRRAEITDVLREETDETYTYRRSDGNPWRTLERDGKTLPADPLLEQTLWFVDPTFGAVSLVELPQRLTWSEDRKAVTVSRRPFEVAVENGELVIRDL